MTNKDILQISMNQSAIDANCSLDDFKKSENIVVESVENANARKYLDLPLYCNFISYGNNVVASTNSNFADIAKNYIDKFPKEHCFETPNMHVINDELQKRDMRICFMAEYFLPDLNVLAELKCKYELKVLAPDDFCDLYKPEWSNPLCEKRKQLDVLAVGAYANDTLIGLAGCSADCDTMWQIGVDVLPEYRQQGVASALTSKLAIETLKRGVVPFYCCAWSNIRSARNAIKSGFRPAWVEMTAKPSVFVAEMNR